MRKLFGVFYGLCGCGFASALTHGLHSFDIAVAGALSLVCFVAAWQAFFKGGWLWRVLHTVLGSGVVAAWAASWIFALPYLTGHAHTVDWGGLAVMLMTVVGVVLTVPAVACLVGFVQWIRRSKVASARPRGERALPAHDGAGDADEPARESRWNMRTRVGAVLLCAATAAWVFWAYAGARIRCDRGDIAACRSLAADEVERGDIDKAIAVYDALWARQRRELGGAGEGRIVDWQARNELLIRRHDLARLDAAAEEMCGVNWASCQALIESLDGADLRDSAARAYRLACERGPGAQCAGFGVWLIARGRSSEGVALLGSRCQAADSASCLALGRQLASDGAGGVAHQVLRRACLLDAQRPTPSSSDGTCRRSLQAAQRIVPRSQSLADALDVCIGVGKRCSEAIAFVESDLHDSAGAREILQQACAAQASSATDADLAAMCIAASQHRR